MALPARFLGYEVSSEKSSSERFARLIDLGFDRTIDQSWLNHEANTTSKSSALANTDELSNFLDNLE